MLFPLLEDCGLGICLPHRSKGTSHILSCLPLPTNTPSQLAPSGRLSPYLKVCIIIAVMVDFNLQGKPLKRSVLLFYSIISAMYFFISCLCACVYLCVCVQAHIPAFTCASLWVCIWKPKRAPVAAYSSETESFPEPIAHVFLARLTAHKS